MECHINAKELLAICFSQKTFVKVPDAQVKLLSDNTTTVHGINSNKSDFYHPISEIWDCGEDIWITASYIPGKENYDVDTEWMLNQQIFIKIISKFQFQPEVDLFISKLNAQLLVFVSYYPDPEAMHIDAFSISWQGRPFYAYPLFAIIVKVLHKIVLVVATGIIVISNWPTQPWYSLLMELQIDILNTF